MHSRQLVQFQQHAAGTFRVNEQIACAVGPSLRRVVDQLRARRRDLCRAGLDVSRTFLLLPASPLPACLAVLTPKQYGFDYPDKDPAAVGIAFKLSVALTREMVGLEYDFYRMLDLVALATIADVAPLRGENRVLARVGLKVLKETTNQGLRALIRSSGHEGKPPNAGRSGFITAPPPHAAGGRGQARRGGEAPTAESEAQAE